jgi:NAD(P)-dependent dehydrogenase (short-subunit alcohol dehydrogenase family)
MSSENKKEPAMNIPQFDLTDRTAIVTGGGQGIGKGICLALAEVGANIIVADMNFKGAEETAREVEALGRKSLAIETDVCNGAQVEAMAQRAMEVFGAIDILVNNAGGPKHMVPIMEMTEAAWDDVVDTNLKSTFLCSRAAARRMIERNKGSIINIASVSAFVAFPLCVPYGASKAGVINFTQSMGHILGSHNIRVNAVAPGSINTGSRKRFFEQHPELEHFHPETVPLGRLGTAEDVAWVVVFLASDASAYVNGQVITIDGGSPR